MQIRLYKSEIMFMDWKRNTDDHKIPILPNDPNNLKLLKVLAGFHDFSRLVC